MESWRSMYAEAMVMLVLATMWLSLPIMPSSAQSQPDLTCWDEFFKCSDEHFNQTSKPEFDVKSPLFNASEFFCCPVLQQAALTKPCFCAINAIIHDDPANTTVFLKIFTLCNITKDDSLATLDLFCAGSTPSTAGALKLLNQGTMSSLQSASVRITQPPSNSETPASAPKTGASNKIALAGSFSGILMLFTYFLYY